METLNLFFGQYIMTFGLRQITGDLPGKTQGRILVLTGLEDSVRYNFEHAVELGDIVVLDQDYSWITAAQSQAAAIVFARHGAQHVITQARRAGIPLVFLPNADHFFLAVKDDLRAQGLPTDLHVAVAVDEQSKASIIPTDEAGVISEDAGSEEKEEPVVVVPDKVELFDAPDFFTSSDPGLPKEMIGWAGNKVWTQYEMKRQGFGYVPQFIAFAFRYVSRWFMLDVRYLDLFDKLGDLDEASAAPEEIKTVLQEMREMIFSTRMPSDLKRYIEDSDGPSFQEDPDDPFDEPSADRIPWLWDRPLIIRLITNTSDLEEYPGVEAGIYLSKENVRIESLAELWVHMQEVCASMWTYEAYESRKNNGISQRAVYGAVQVQEYMADAEYSMHIETQIDGKPDILKIMLMPGAARSISSTDAKYANDPYIFYYDVFLEELILWDHPRTEFHPVEATKNYYAAFDADEPQSFNSSQFPELHELFTSRKPNALIERLEKCAKEAVAIDRLWQSPRDIEATMGPRGFAPHQNRRLGIAGVEDPYSGDAIAQMVARLRRLFNNLERDIPALQDYFEQYADVSFSPESVSGAAYHKITRGLMAASRADDLWRSMSFGGLIALVFLSGGDIINVKAFCIRATQILEALTDSEFDAERGPLLNIIALYVYGMHQYALSWLSMLATEQPELFALLAPYYIISDEQIERFSNSFPIPLREEEFMVYKLVDDENNHGLLLRAFIDCLCAADIERLLHMVVRLRVKVTDMLLPFLKMREDYGVVCQSSAFRELFPEECDDEAAEDHQLRGAANSAPMVPYLRTFLDTLDQTFPALHTYLKTYAGEAFDPDTVTSEALHDIYTHILMASQSDEVWDTMPENFLAALAHLTGGNLTSLLGFESQATRIVEALADDSFASERAPLLHLIALFVDNAHHDIFAWLKHLSEERPELFSLVLPHFILSKRHIDQLISMKGRGILQDTIVFRLVEWQDYVVLLERSVQVLSVEDVERFLAVTHDLHLQGSRILVHLKTRDDYAEITQLASFKELYPDEAEVAPAVDAESMAYLLRQALDGMQESMPALYAMFECNSDGSFDPNDLDVMTISEIYLGMRQASRADDVWESAPSNMIIFLLYLTGGHLGTQEEFNDHATEILATFADDAFKAERDPLLFLIGLFVQGAHQYILDWLIFLKSERPELLKVLMPYFIVSEHHMGNYASLKYYDANDDYIVLRILFDAEYRTLLQFFIEELAADDVIRLLHMIGRLGTSHADTILGYIIGRPDFDQIRESTAYQWLFGNEGYSLAIEQATTFIKSA